ncbi:MAG: Gp19/Gp15/Gp42 family protein [Micropruina sp.]
MADPFATAADLAAVWRPLSVAEQARANALLTIASAIIREACPEVDDRLTATPPTLDAAIPKWVACQMARRVMANDLPGAVSQMQQGAGPFTQGLTFANPTGDLYLGKSELRMLGCGQQRAATIPMYRTPA